MPILIDGNNLMHSLSRKPVRRSEVRQLVLDSCRRERMTVIVVFDGPPPAGAPAMERLGAVTVLYSQSDTADDVILRRLPSGGPAREWVVVTDDRVLADRARQRGAQVRSTAEWRQPRRARPRAPEWQPKLSSREIAEWEEFFSGNRREDD
jgi:hypothetical protein